MQKTERHLVGLSVGSIFFAKMQCHSWALMMARSLAGTENAGHCRPLWLADFFCSACLMLCL